MKKITSILIIVLSLFVLTLTLTACDSSLGGNTEPVLGEYEYKFTLGKDSDTVDIAYVAKTSYVEAQDSTSYEIFAKVDNTLISHCIASGSFSGKEGELHVNGLWTLNLKDGKLTPSAASTSYGIIQDYSVYAGTYALNENSEVDETLELQSSDLNLTLKADGTGSLINKTLFYFPLGGDSIVIFEDDDKEDGLVIELNRLEMTHNPTHDRLTFNFVRGTDFANYYKIFFDESGTKIRSGEGFFNDSTLHTNDTHFLMIGKRWVIGRYELKDGIMSVIYDGEEDHESVKLTVTDTFFDYERATTHYSTDKSKYVHIYKNGLAFISDDGTTYELAKNADGLNVIAVCTQNYDGEKRVQVYDKETLTVSFRLPGDTYVDLSGYDVYEDVANEYLSEVARNLYISPDGNSMFMSSHYLMDDSPIEYYDMKSKFMGYASVKVKDKIIVSQDRYYFLFDGKFIDTDANDDGSLRSLLNYATDSTISAMTVKTRVHYSNNENVYGSEYSAYVAKITLDDSTTSVIYVMLTVDNYGGKYMDYRLGRTLLADENGLTIMSDSSNLFTLIKDASNTLNIETYELDFNAYPLEYFAYEDGYVVIKDKNSNTYYLINDSTLTFDYIINDDNYAGIRDAEIISMAGAENVAVQHYYYGDIILLDDGKLYVPSDSIWYIDCMVYESYECTVYEDLTTGRLIKYVKDEDTTIHLFVNEKGYYDFYISDDFDPENLKAFEKVGDITVYDNATYQGSNMTLELTEYANSSDTKYFLAVGYVLYEYEDTGNTISGAGSMTLVLTFGISTESADGYVITGMDGYVYTITIDGNNATVEQAANS